ncbi:uncharacterized protein LOC119278980 isoform X1 [Triticum dicoccoides]|uniref:uncharacterized protein LOC119278980 isoform X1 n=1 Tax=Triticum dicoccoides TaxID=85692 RepID=UPI00188E7BF1|nr:uncharacterized protein LOC119278980 isoform X1 [Triticum dicoccoides]
MSAFSQTMAHLPTAFISTSVIPCEAAQMNLCVVVHGSSVIFPNGALRGYFNVSALRRQHHPLLSKIHLRPAPHPYPLLGDHGCFFFIITARRSAATDSLRQMLKVVTFVSRSGTRYYKCVRKDAGLCQFMRSTKTYLPELTRHGLLQPYVLQAASLPCRPPIPPSGPLQRRLRREHNFDDGGQAEIQPAHVSNQPPLQQSTVARAAPQCCFTDSQRTTLLLAGTNFILVVAMLKQLV